MCLVFFIICFAHTIHSHTVHRHRHRHSHTRISRWSYFGVYMLDESCVFVQFALLTKLWFLTSRVSIETLRSSVVCCARYCEVCLFFVRLFVCFDCCALAVFSSSSVALRLRLRYHRFGRSVVIDVCECARACVCVYVIILPIYLVCRWTEPFLREMHTTNLHRIGFDLDRRSCA